MFSLVITEKSGAQRQLDFEGPEINIGRLEDNDICLPKNNVSKYHARLVFKDDRFVLLDQKSTNGTYVNGRRISAPLVVRKGDKIYIGDFILTLVTGESAIAARRAVLPEPSSERLDPLDPLDSLGSKGGAPAATLPTRSVLATERPRETASETEAVSFEGAESDAPESIASETVASLRPPPLLEGPDQHTQRPPAAPGMPPASALHPARPATVPLSVAPPPRASLPPAADDHTRVAPAPAAATLAIAPPPIPASIPAASQRARSAHAAPKSIPPWADDPLATSGGRTSPAAIAPSVRLQGALSLLMERLAEKLNVAHDEESAFPSEHQATLERLMDELADEGAIGADLDRRFLREAAISEAVGLGPLDRLLANRGVYEVVVDGPARVLADLGGGLTPVSAFFSGTAAVLTTARRLLRRAGRELDMQAHAQEAQLPGGGLVQILLPPLSPKGALLTLRCPPRALRSAESMVTDGMLSNDMLALLRAAMQRQKNILVLGPLGSGVSTLLAAIAGLAQDHERMVCLEDAPSISLAHGQMLPLSRRSAPHTTLSALIEYAARLRPDRWVIDDCKGQDALPALTTAAAARGVLIGTHAPNPETALTQLELFAQASLGGARMQLSSLLASALQVLVHVAAGKDGVRRVQSISEVRGAHGDTLEVRVLYRHDGSAFRVGDQRASFLA